MFIYSDNQGVYGRETSCCARLASHVDGKWDFYKFNGKNKWNPENNKEN